MSKDSTTTPPTAADSSFLSSAIVFPIVMAAMLTAIIKLTVPFQEISADSDYASITTPEHNSRITRSYTIDGELKQDFTSKFVFIVEVSDEAIYPKSVIGNASGKWSANLYTGAPAGKDIGVQLVAVDAADRALFTTWFETGATTGIYPGITSVPSLQLLSQITVSVSDD